MQMYQYHKVLVIFLTAAILAGVGFSLPTAAEPAPGSPDWMNGSLTLAKLSDYTWADGDQYTYGNIPCESVSGYVWGWQSNGWFSWRVKTLTAQCATPGASIYTGYRQILPFGSSYWQALDLTTNYYHVNMYPNPGTNGLAIVTNSYRDYANIPTQLYYTNDVLSLFNVLSTDSSGTVVRSPSRQFEHILTYPDGRTFDLHNVYAISYSANGQWMYANVSDTAQLRIKTSDFSVLSFAPGQEVYYSPFSATANSGNTVATYSYDRGLKLYDLTRCEAEKPDYGSRNCASRDISMTTIREKVLETVSDPSSLTQVAITEIKFLTESRIRLLVQYVHNGENKYMFMTLSTEAGESSTRYLALGDSFSSGEGIFTYRKETNFYTSQTDYNLCHTSTWSYPYMVSANVKSDWMNSVACSGAISSQISNQFDDDRFINNVSDQRINNPQEHIDLIKTNPGYLAQNKYVDYYSPNVVTLTMGGNDIGFGNIVYECVTQSCCFSSREEREAKADEIAAMIPAWKSALTTIQDNMSWQHQRLYVVGYPEIMNDENSNCSLVGKSERQHLNELERYLNESIRVAAIRAGAHYIDMSDVFYGQEAGMDRRLCGEGPFAVNGFLPNWYADEHSSVYKPDQIFANESYHPNLVGHILMAQRILSRTNQFKDETADEISATFPTSSSTVYKDFVGDNDDLLSGIYSTMNTTVQFVIKGTDMVIKTGTNILSQLDITAILHSDPVVLGAIKSDASGEINTTVHIPESTSPGFHRLELHFTVDDIERVLYEYVYVAASADDYDGDGIPNNQETCSIGGVLGVDWNKNGVDDACDSYSTGPSVDNSTVQRIVNTGKVTNDDIKELVSFNPVPSAVDSKNTSANMDEQKITAGNSSKISQTNIARSAGSKHTLLYVILGMIACVLIVLLRIKIMHRGRK